MISLKETRAETTLYPVIVKNVDRLGPKLIGFNFDGYSLSNAALPVFAVSSTAALPATFRPIFPQKVNSWSSTYALPLLPAEQANYFFIGDLEVDNGGRPGKKLRIAKYKLDGFDAVRIGFDREQSEPLLQMKAKLVEGVLYTEHDKFGVKRPIPAEIVKEVRAQCIEPILNPKNKGGATSQERKKLPGKAQLLTPIQIFELDAEVISGEPLFTDKTIETIEVTTATDSLEEMIDAEKAQLKTIFERAFQNPKYADEYLQLIKNLSTKKNRIKIYMPLLGEQYSKVLVKTNSDQNFNLAKQYFYHFAENIYPASQGMKNKEFAYNLSVVASQELVLYGNLKD